MSLQKGQCQYLWDIVYDQNHISRSTNRLIVYMKNPDLDCQRAYKQAP